MGLFRCMVYCCCCYDSHFGRVPIQYGLVGVYLPCWSVLNPTPLTKHGQTDVFWTGVFTLQTITIGEELESRFFKVLSCVS